MANRLIRYEARLFRRSLSDGFRGPADIALLALLAIVGIAWLRDRATSAHALPFPPEALWWAALAGPVGFTLQRFATQRLAWLAEHSPLAPDALEAKGRRTWLGVAHLFTAMPVLAAAALLGMALGRPATALAIAGVVYGAGTGLASIMPAGRRGTARARRDPPALATGNGARAVIELVLRRQTMSRAHAQKRGALLVAGNFMLTLAAGWWGAGQPDALRVAVMLLPSLAILLLGSRLDPAMLGFLPYAGYRPAFIAAAVSALPAASLAAAIPAVLLTGPAASAGVLLILALGHLGFILVATARAWLYPGRQPRSVDLQLQLEGAGLLAIAFLLPPLAIAAAGWRLWRFRQHCRALRWAQP
jgi:hypothetical protein